MKFQDKVEDGVRQSNHSGQRLCQDLIVPVT